MATIAAIAKEEVRIQEWLDYHFSIGFTRAIIVTNDWDWKKKDPSDKRITVRVLNGPKKQLQAYNDILRFDNKDWTAFIDIDEFIVVPEGLHTILRGTRPIALSWRMYAGIDSGGETLMERFRHWRWDHHIKVITPPGFQGHFLSPHNLNVPAYTLGGTKVTGAHTTAYSDRGWINHYYYQDLFHWGNKMKRGRVDVTAPHAQRTLAEYLTQSKLYDEVDQKITQGPQS
jgi:hypothetical protein